MKRSGWKAKVTQVEALILITLGLMIAPASAQSSSIQASIIPPNPYEVYTGQTYALSVGVQFNVPSTTQVCRPPPCPPTTYYFWIESPPYMSDVQTLQGSGGTYFSLVLSAPSTPGTYTLPLYLYAQTSGAGAMLIDQSSVTYRVVEPVKTDWDVGKVWTDPASPGEGDQVTFHVTIVLTSTTSQQALTVTYACSLDKRLYYSGSLNFTPQPSSQDATIPTKWTATKGPHVMLCAVDPNREHNDPTPYPNYNYKQLSFTVEPYYAIIQKITVTPSGEIKEGEMFNVVVTVEYRFSGTASLKVHHHNNGTLPPSDNEALDTATGAGTKDYTFQVRAPFTRSTSSCTGTWIMYGTGSVIFDKGAGWQKTVPGWIDGYNVTVARPSYYAVFDSVTAEYTGATNGIGTVHITLQVRYLLPIESGLKIVVSLPANTSWQGGLAGISMLEVMRDQSTITQQESVERTVTHTYDYNFPLSSTTSDTMQFTATVDFLTCGVWNRGDAKSASASVPYTPPPESYMDYAVAAFQTIVEWFKSLFGMGRGGQISSYPFKKSITL